MKLVSRIFVFTLMCPWLLWASEISLLGKQIWKPGEKIHKTKIGGWSSLIVEGDSAYILSDDRGLVNEPRFYSFKISQHKNLWRLGEGQVHFLSLPTTGKVKTVVDPESIVKLPTGSFLVASEGDNNKRPRVPPRIFEVDAKGKWLRDLKLPDVLIPEALGQAKKGVSNNFSIEAMALSKEGSAIWFTTEKPLVQDITLESDKSPYRLFHFNLETGKSKQYFFEAPEMEEQNEGVVLVRGWTEIIHLGDKKFWFLERSLRLGASKILQYDCRLLELDFEKSSLVTKLRSLKGQNKLVPAKINFIQKLTDEDQALGNCEGMALGPSRTDFKQTLWVITDNNFSKSDSTVLYFFGVKN